VCTALQLDGDVEPPWLMSKYEVDGMTVHLLPMTIQETLYIGSFIVTFIDL